jgi:hypothetical protein
VPEYYITMTCRHGKQIKSPSVSSVQEIIPIIEFEVSSSSQQNAI